MKAVRFHNPDGNVVLQPVNRTALQNGIKVSDVPDLISAWEKMGAITRRTDGGLNVIRFIEPKDPEALAEMRRIQGGVE